MICRSVNGSLPINTEKNMVIWTINETIDVGEGISFIRDESRAGAELHSHEFVEIQYVLDGKGLQTINGKEYSMTRGSVSVFETGASHSYKSIDRLAVFNFMIHPDVYKREVARMAREMKDNTALPVFMMLSKRRFAEVEDLLLSSEREFYEKRPGYKSICKNNFSTLLILLYRNAHEAENSGQEDLRDRILDYIGINCGNVSLSDISNHFGYEFSYFSKLFRKLFGTTFSRYAAEVKINEAVRLIKNTNYSVESVCRKLGYSDKKQFYKHFREKTGMTPNKMRN